MHVEKYLFEICDLVHVAVKYIYIAVKYHQNPLFFTFFERPHSEIMFLQYFFDVYPQ